MSTDDKQEMSKDDWHCGGWEGARRETYRHMLSLTFDQKLVWLEGAQQLTAEIHGWEAALLPSGSTVKPRWDQLKSPASAAPAASSPTGRDGSPSRP